jgi:formylglycine-generating enzyme required for sulfatase activity
LRAGPGLLPILAGHFVMGDSEGDANEAPRAATVKPLRLMRHEVTNRHFDAFVARTNHLTDADSYFPGCPLWVKSRHKLGHPITSAFGG